MAVLIKNLYLNKVNSVFLMQKSVLGCMSPFKQINCVCVSLTNAGGDG